MWAKRECGLRRAGLLEPRAALLCGWSYHCGANSAALSSYACTKPSMMSFAASRFLATDAPSWERHHLRTRCSTAEAASSPILADAIVLGITTFERIAEY